MENELTQYRTRPSEITPFDEPTDELARVKSTLEIPNGGLTAWLQVLCGFFAFFCSWGIVNAFGVFQSYYASSLNISNSGVAWIGSINSFLLCFLAVIFGPLFDKGHGRLLFAGGAFLMIFGVMMTSLATKYWQIILTQGVCCGTGSAALFLCSVSTLPGYFTTKRALAIGIAASGSSLGGIIWPIVFHKLQPQIGFPWAVRVVGFIALAVLAIPVAVFRPRTRPGKKFFDVSAFRELRFNVFNVACFLGMMGQYIPFFYMQEYAQSVSKLGAFSFYMTSIINVGSVFGRIVPAFLADHYGPMNVMFLCTGLSGVIAFCWIGAYGEASLVVVSILYGFFSGAFVSLTPAAIVVMTKDLKVIGARMGMNSCFSAFALLIGNPVGGIIVKSSWTGLKSMCGAAMIASAMGVLITRIMVVGFTPRAKA